MKKFWICLTIILFVILFSILFFKFRLPNTKYSNENIYALVQKGIENMQDMQNVCIERKNVYAVNKYYYKGNKMKMAVIESNDGNTLVSYTITDLDKEKLYIVSDKKKMISVQKATHLNKGLQFEVFYRINIKDANAKRELSYIKDEKLEGKDCIFVKEVYSTKASNGTWQTNNKTDASVSAYWIEKSTGFVLGTAMIKPEQTNATPDAWIKNLTFNEVLDSDFDLPINYQVYE